MDDSASADAASADPTASSGGRTDSQRTSKQPEVTVISAAGDLVLAVTFENSKTTIRAARKAQAIAPVSASRPAQPAAQPRTRVAFRVQPSVLKRQSPYFDRLLGDSRFKEAKHIADTLAALSLRNIKPADADASELPWVEITDDDEATLYAHRELVFADLLRILHGQPAVGSSPKITPQYVTTLAVFADRFDCTAPVSSYVNTSLKFKWPVTSRKVPAGSGRGGDENPGLSRAAEDVLRQKILVGWLLNQPVKFQSGTRELILSGSFQWSTFAADYEDEGQQKTPEASWWYLPEGIEEELQYRRQCVLNTVASIQQHFMMLYSSRNTPRQCKLGYDSSAACDSYQLGEMMRFLVNKSLLFLVDFSPASLDRIGDSSQITVESLLTTLRQCPSYQIDKNHANCGLRTRMLPILDFVQGLLSSNAVPLSRQAWKQDRTAAAWLPQFADDPPPGGAKASSKQRPAFSVSNGTDDDGDSPPSNQQNGTGAGKPFRFTRTMAGDSRLRSEGALGVDRFAKQVFLSSSWDWTADDDAVAWSNPGKMGRVPFFPK